ncbi:hypothetical protein PoB_002656600 [Plakobranchus ocellatus]|uniref:Uncharacterized protein n=1 Tax=Plakobranchus ocellatus TaxID=259542 RepID=A0AAV3ZZW3_9GAST|nr:hypothetical protein PoB_002656600 [Plakobranchus ocellatus]
MKLLFSPSTLDNLREDMESSKDSSPPCLEPVTTDEDDLHDMPTLEVQTDLDLADGLHTHNDSSVNHQQGEPRKDTDHDIMNSLL